MGLPVLQCAIWRIKFSVMRRFSSKSDPVVEVEVGMTMDDVRNDWPGACACAYNPVTSDRQGRIESPSCRPCLLCLL